MRLCAICIAMVTAWLLLFKTEESTHGTETTIATAYQGQRAILSFCHCSNSNSNLPLKFKLPAQIQTSRCRNGVGSPSTEHKAACTQPLYLISGTPPLSGTPPSATSLLCGTICFFGTPPSLCGTRPLVLHPLVLSSSLVLQCPLRYYIPFSLVLQPHSGTPISSQVLKPTSGNHAALVQVRVHRKV